LSDLPEVLGSEGGCLAMAMVGGQILGARMVICASLLQLFCYAGSAHQVVEDLQIQNTIEKVNN